MLILMDSRLRGNDVEKSKNDVNWSSNERERKVSMTGGNDGKKRGDMRLLRKLVV
jgi:hypothetical protein